LASLTNLTSLNLWENGIGAEGARALASLTNLTSLNLGDNGVGAEGARALASLTNLTSLDLWKNGIGDEGARALAALTNLTSLSLWENDIGDEGARALVALTNLTALDLRGNRIGAEGARALLDVLLGTAKAGGLQRLDLRDNGDLSSILPTEVFESRDAQAILAAWRRYRTAAAQATLRPLNEAKLLVVGNEAVGKTSLIRYLISNQPRDPNERKTPGTAIHEKIETRAWSPEGSAVTLNVWDFGGQEIMHGTHRFFLTERSLYLLVLESRREDDRSVYDWLKTIRNLGGDWPVIVVVNKCDHHAVNLRLDETGLKQNHPAIAGFARTSCDPGEKAAASIARLRELVVEQLVGNQRLKHVRDPIPQPWLRIKEAVAERARHEHVLALRDFERLCEMPPEDAGDAITDSDEQRALLQLLHDLGVVVAHGLRRDARAALREITLLDPNWLTGAVYTLLNSPTVRDQGGELARAQLAQLLDPKLYPGDRHEFILDMMEDPEIGLCFELPGTDHERYLIPEALPASEPDYGVWPENALRFRFRYDLLPPGLIPRFIVQAHRNLTDKPTRWRTGVVLGAAGCRILVRGDRDRRQIDVSVAGPPGLRRSALNVVLDDLDEVHARNPEIGAKALVPLPDQSEIDVSYDHLLRLEKRYGLDYAFDPEDADRSYVVCELLEGVRRDRSLQPDDERQALRLKAGEPARITVVEAGLRGGGAGGQLDPHITSGDSNGSWRSMLASWPFLSVACGAGAVVVALVLMMLPSHRLIVGGLIGLGALVTVIMLSMNPKFFYRRALGYVLSGGLLVNALGFSIDAFGTSAAGIGGFRWDGTVSWAFFIAWAAVVGFLVYGDTRQSQ